MTFYTATANNAWDSTICPPYDTFSQNPSKNVSTGARRLPNMRPQQKCRSFNSTALERVIQEVTPRFKDPDLAVLFANAFSQTLDTTVRWYNATTPLAFVVTGDIPAEWMRDVSNQMNVYLPLIKEDLALRQLLLGVINLQAYYLSKEPFCSAFSAPPVSGIPPLINTGDEGHITNPAFDAKIGYICQLEIDGLASFISLSLRYWQYSGELNFFTPTWLDAIQKVLGIFEGEMRSTFDDNGFIQNTFNFTSPTNPVKNLGVGAPQLYNGLIGTSMRPSDDRVAWHFNIPDNALIAVQTEKLSAFFQSQVNQSSLARRASRISQIVRKAIETHGVVEHPTWGSVYAYEVDGYGSVNLMDDANVPSLLSFPYLGYVEADSPIYQATRKMLLSQRGNPYYWHGSKLKGIGSPHTNPGWIWPMSLASLIFSSTSDDEIEEAIELITNTTGGLGLIHESIDVNNDNLWSREWFGWANSYMSEAILYLADKKPHLIFKEGVSSYPLSSEGGIGTYGLVGQSYFLRSKQQSNILALEHGVAFFTLAFMIIICIKFFTRIFPDGKLNYYIKWAPHQHYVGV
ncbi:hypothetical protein O181_023354 [Austropuccinia psidii MF-1]|uniref:Glycoside hydrolase family 125 protein n=1 Tax=Austropuccinia psidii MF-1 TaxID=1389203 RepID=A0A9Q3GYK5_9BASI|nr:hypothetical protein [Austropuccinia psidii MF-1]